MSQIRVVEAQTAGHDVCGHVGQQAVGGPGMGPQPHQRLGQAHPELHTHHPGGLVHLGPVGHRLRPAGARLLGVLGSGPLLDGQLADALALADTVTVLLLHRVLAETAGDTDKERRPRPGCAQSATYRAGVHQATGMISVQLNVSLAEALVRLRAHAYAQERPIAEVAADVVTRRLRFADPNR